MASTSIAAGPPERESTNTSPRCSSCFGRVSSFIPRCSAQSKPRASTSTIPDNEAPASFAVGRLEREPDSSNGSMAAFDGIAPSASSSVSKRTQKPAYDVFINHRGPDVKHTLANTLYTILTGMSLSVFLDSQELEYGDFLPQTIEAAMASALLHIAIFSKRYAESPWCLAELSFMLKSGTKIIPIFYQVDPNDLRWVHQGKGMYVEAFKQHEQKGRYSPEQVQEWKSALHNISFYSGQIVKTNEDEMKLLKTIVSCVLKEINNNVPLVVAKHPVGLKEIVEDFKVNALSSAHANQGVQIVGIWGMGGSGKTTLAKELYNEISFSMDRSSFVFDVRDAATKGLLHEKQKKLLHDLGIQGLEFDNIEDGVRNLSRGLRSVRVLIVLDDVDNMEQLDALLPTKHNLQKGSLIIVTTRVCDILKSWGISSIYKMRQLDPLYAKQLFCWHAFLKPNPLDGFKELVEQFLEACNGLPLSLKVFGAQLYGESRKEYWKSQLHKISKILSNDIKQSLKISYDSLDDEEKEMFLDTACFFIGQEISFAIEVWNGVGWSALQSWERLLNRCLVELDNKNCIRMHDHIRDLGRDIANKHSPYRLWFPQQIIDVQKQIKKRIGIQGIVATASQIHLDDYYQVPVITDKTDEVDGFHVCCLDGKLMVNTNGGIWSLSTSLVGLKYLVISGDNFNQVMSDISRELVWLRWFQIGQRNLPSRLPLRKLRILELSERSDAEHHHLEELWGQTHSKGPLQLRQLLISHCHNFQGFPNSIGFLIHLKKIVIIESHNITSLPDEFCNLQSLEHLALFLCKRLSSLPSNFGNLSNLCNLNLWNCMDLRRLPVTFKNLKLLKYLNLGRCSQLTFTSEDLNFLENITKLEFLNLSECKKLEQWPRHVTNQASMRELYFSGTSLRELPDDIGQLNRLTGMTIHHLSLTSLPTSLGDLSSLTYLIIRDCPRLERLGVKCLPESIRRLKNLQKLRLSDCPIAKLDFGAASLPRFGLSKLKEIALKETEVCRIAFSEDCCPHLESLHLSNNHHLEEIEALSRTLKSICLANSEMLKNIPSFAGFTSLRKFHLRGCYGIEKIEGLENCTRLEKLTVQTCWEVPGIESLEHMQNLNRLELRANKGSVIEHCIQRIEKWPDERLIICARAAPDAASLVHSLLFPNLIIVDSISNQNIVSRPKLVLKSPSNDDAIMFCCVINCVSSQMTLRSKRKEYSIEVGSGRWALVGVVTQRCSGIEGEDCGQVEFSIRGNEYAEHCGEVEKGLVVRGAEQTAVEALRSLLPLLLQS